MTLIYTNVVILHYYVADLFDVVIAFVVNMCVL